MNLGDAITAFEVQRRGCFSKADRARIVATAGELGLSDFVVYVAPSKNYPQFIRDVDDVLHVHPTMLVAGRSFRDSTDRGADPYPKYPHHLALAEWIHEKGVSGRPVCPTCHLEVPLVGQCDHCGWSSLEPE